MEYKNSFIIIFGLLAFLFWALDFWYFGKRPQLHFPINKKMLMSSSNKIAAKLLIFFFGCIAWALICYSLLGPREAHKFENTKIEINDIYFVVDVSRSMLAEDFAPNRLEVAKKKIYEFIKLRPKDRIGIIIFSEKAFTLLPLTTDLGLIKEVIQDIQVGFLGSGTNIGDALGLAVGRGIASLAENKVIILLTDGVSNVGNLTPIKAAEMAKEQGIKVYTVGIGSDKDAKIPVGNGLFGKTYQYIPGGSIDLKTLKSIADMTGGKSYVARDEQSLQNVLDEIEKLERTEIELTGHIVYDEKYYNFLLTGVVLFLLVDLLRRFGLKEVL